MTNLTVLEAVIKDMDWEERSYLLLDTKIMNEEEEIINLCEAGYAGLLDIEDDLPF